MKRKSLLVCALSLLLAGGATYALAQDAAPPSAPADSKNVSPPRRDAAPRAPAAPAPLNLPMASAEPPVLADLRELERLYTQAGRVKELPALYNAVLAKSQDPRVRTYTYHQLARAQMEPANMDQAIATLRKSLDENLAEEAKRREDIEKLRMRLELRPAAPPPPTPSA
ncbi:hypothetical protein KK141_06740 [Dyella sp. LX-66]|uniref:hypothetical protein n=1 Tax=unclassified Dyella TaxID=2634549 RepID=UPI001BE0B976|nr:MULTISPECIES: hypothetical protein [unclassified Dyella]MBT2115407.1 hypothetical protein [Dyella sp. LX-1]MBT2139222.1 hypothetical protein [Dyella sp. LX-66]